MAYLWIQKHLAGCSKVHCIAALQIVFSCLIFCRPVPHKSSIDYRLHDGTEDVEFGLLPPKESWMDTTEDDSCLLLTRKWKAWLDLLKPAASVSMEAGVMEVERAPLAHWFPGPSFPNTRWIALVSESIMHIPTDPFIKVSIRITFLAQPNVDTFTWK